MMRDLNFKSGKRGVDRTLSQVRGIALLLGAGYLLRRWVARQQAASIKDKVVLITGASRGLGLLLARQFAEEGCRVCICARDQRVLYEAQKILADWGAAVSIFVCDVAEQEQVAELVKTITAQFGSIDILVNNAAIIHVGPLASIAAADMKRSMDIILWGTVHATLAVLPQMVRNNNGYIVNIASIGGKVAVPHLLSYTTAKFALTGFSEGLGAELRQHGISVTTIIPSLMRTGGHFHALINGDHEAEYRWFSTMMYMPVISITARRAAREIVDATKRRETERILTLSSNVLARLHGIFPALTNHLLYFFTRLFLPRVQMTNQTTLQGKDIILSDEPSWIRSLLAQGEAVARRLNQLSASRARVVASALVEESTDGTGYA